MIVSTSRLHGRGIRRLAMLTLTAAQQRPAPSRASRLYVFENGSIRGLDPKLFNFTREELKEVDFTNTSVPHRPPEGDADVRCRRG